MPPLYDRNGVPFAPTEPAVGAPVDSFDGYSPTPSSEHLSPELRAELQRDLDAQRGTRLDAEAYGAVDLDGFANELTGIGTLSHDKTKGGLPGGPPMLLYRISGNEAEARQRGSDFGMNIVEKIPDEMTREGWSVEVQPTEDEAEIASDPRAALDAARREPARAAAGWRLHADRTGSARARTNARRWDAIARGDEMPVEGLPPPPPAPLPHLNDEGIEVGRAMDRITEEMGVLGAVHEALKYERAFGGGAILIGADDGQEDLTKPLDETSIRSVHHLTTFFGGWDGEVIAWSYYSDKTKPKYGLPMIYQVRNIGVPLARQPAPGETNPQPYTMERGPAGPMVRYIHESRFLIFDGSPTSRRARVEMRGWGDSVFTRANDVLSQYEQSWSGLAILLQEFSIATLAMDKLSEAVASEDPKRQGAIQKRALALHMSMSIARTRLIDSREKYERMTASIAGVPELMEQFALRLAAAVDMPVSMLFGQVKGGLGDAGNTDLRFFYDRVAAKQRKRLLPQLQRLYRLIFLSKEGPTKGVEPERWSIAISPLWQMTATEKADVRLKVTQADQIAISTGQVSPEEVAATRYGGADFSDASIVLDLEGRAEMRAIEQRHEQAAAAAGVRAVSASGAQPTKAATPLDLTPSSQGAIVKVNEARAQLGLPPLTTSAGALDPDGELTIAEFSAKRAGPIVAAAQAEKGVAPAPAAPGLVPGAPEGSAAAPAAIKLPTPATTPPATPEQVVANEREKLAAQHEQQVQSARAAKPAALKPKPPEKPPAVEPPGSAPENATPIGMTSPAQPVTVPAMIAMPSDPITADPTSMPSTIGNTVKGTKGTGG